MQRTTIVLIAWLSAGLAAWAQDQAPTQRGQSASAPSKIYKLEELRWPQVDALDRGRTLFILPVGMAARTCSFIRVFPTRFPLP